jgi:biopolymer transport protein ExbD
MTVNAGSATHAAINVAAITSSSLAERLSAVFERRGDRVLFLKAAESLDYAVVASAIDTAHGVRIDRVALMPR